MNKKILFGILIMSLILIPQTALAGDVYMCNDDGNIFYNTTIGYSINTNSSVYVMNQTIVCPFGCDERTLTCIPAPVNRDFMLLGFLILIVIVFGVAWKKMR